MAPQHADPHYDPARELVRSKVEVIVATGSPTYRVLQRMSAALPVAVTVTFDPVSEGLAESLPRPGGNFTGLSDTAADLGPKQLELVKAVSPRLAAQKDRIQVVLAEAGTVAGIERGFASLARERAEAVIFFGDTFFAQQFPRISKAALKYRDPSIYITREYAEAGGLMTYGPT